MTLSAKPRCSAEEDEEAPQDIAWPGASLAFAGVTAWTGTMQNTGDWMNYNRNAWGLSVSFHQKQLYQRENFRLWFAALARHDILAMMRCWVHRINNYQLVAALLVALDGAQLFQHSLSRWGTAQANETYVAFTWCLACGMMWLLASILIALKGQNILMTLTMRLLTFKVRPKNPEKYTHNYLVQSQQIERMGWRALFRIPGMNMDWGVKGRHLAGVANPAADQPNTFKGHSQTSGPQQAKHSGFAPAPVASPKQANHFNSEDSCDVQEGLDTGPENPEGLKPEEVDLGFLEDVRIEHFPKDLSVYMFKFAKFVGSWYAFESRTKTCMGLGVLCMGQAGSYAIAGKFMYRLGWGAVAAIACFVYVAVLAGLSDRKRVADLKFRLLVFIMISAGPACLTTFELVQDQVTRSAVAFAGCISHVLLWALIWFMFEITEFKDPLEFVGEDVPFWLQERQRQELARQPTMTKLRRSVSTFGDSRAEVRLPSSGSLTCSMTSSIAQGGDREIGEWPTDDEEDFFYKKLVKSSNKATDAVVRGMLLSNIVSWTFITIASIFPLAAACSAESGSTRTPAMAKALEVPVEWPGPLFRPHLLTSAQGHIWASDRFRIYELSLSGSSRPVECVGLDHPLTDLTAVCDLQACFPVAFVNSTSSSTRGAQSQPYLVNCRDGLKMTLFEDEKRPITRVAFVSPAMSLGLTPLLEQSLLTASSTDTVLYKWMTGAMSWIPTSRSLPLNPDLGYVKALSAANNNILILQNNPARSTFTLVHSETFQHLTTVGVQLSVFGSKDPLVSACLVNTTVALVLPSNSAFVAKQQVLQLNL